MDNHSTSAIRSKFLIFKENKKALISAIVLLIFAIIAIFAPYIARHSYTDMDPNNLFALPSWNHLLGTDNFGRDVFSRIVHGSRISFFITITVTLITIVIGLPLGIISGYFGGWIDRLISAYVNIIISFPWLLLALTLVAILGSGIKVIIIAFGILYTPHLIRLTRGIVLSIKGREYIDNAIITGEGSFSIMFRYILPNCMGPVIIRLTLLMSEVILSAAAVSYLGYGVQPPTPDWGIMLSESSNYMYKAPILSLFPGVVIVIFVLSINFLGDGLRDILDPKGAQ